MKIALTINIVRSGGKVEAGTTIHADSLSLLPIPVPNIGERIVFSIERTLYKGIVTHKEIEMIQIDDLENGVLGVTVWADQEVPVRTDF
jgi:hypothetical protein